MPVHCFDTAHVNIIVIVDVIENRHNSQPHTHTHTHINPQTDSNH